jgi:teichuronic acid biosynthesis glycosyltransferase TuaC
MDLLVVVTNYPHAGHPYSGAFNERSVRALTKLGHRVDVLAPRPFLPRRLAALHPRWRAYQQIVKHEVRHGVSVYRPAYLQLPGSAGALSPDSFAYLSCVRTMSRRHEADPYDAILAFSLVGAGGLAWRLARRLDIPAAGWATGTDVRVPVHSAHGRAVRAAIQRLDLVFYQSRELFERAAALCDLPTEVFSRERHVVLPRGVEPAPPASETARQSMRARLGVAADELLVLFVGRIVKAKGVFELIDAVEQVRSQNGKLVCVLVGAHDGFDDSAELAVRLERIPEHSKCVRVLPACPSEMVWEYLNAADIFAFPSHAEGMPNSLLEAMAAGIPAVAYSIPPVLEIDAGLDALLAVPPQDVRALASALSELAGSAERRRQIGEQGRARVLSAYQTRASMAEAASRLYALAGRDSRGASLAPARAPIFSAGSAGSRVSSKSQ